MIMIVPVLLPSESRFCLYAFWRQRDVHCTTNDLTIDMYHDPPLELS